MATGPSTLGWRKADADDYRASLPPIILPTLLPTAISVPLPLRLSVGTRQPALDIAIEGLTALQVVNGNGRYWRWRWAASYG